MPRVVQALWRLEQGALVSHENPRGRLALKTPVGHDCEQVEAGRGSMPHLY